ncbi:MAG TPA: YdcF family protein [Smithellaceae bacterium]|nr:YdcF family protein [Smithellaceae bacterium]
MNALYVTLKSMVDPVFIIFVLLIIALVLCLIEAKRKTGVLVLFFAVVLLYGAGIAPAAQYLSYYLEKDYINNPVATDKNPDIIVVLGGGTLDISAMKKTFPNDATAARLLHALEIYHKKGAKYLVCSGKGNSNISEAEVMARIAEKLGVPKEKIRIEARSHNTWEHAVEFNKMFADKKLVIGLVTSGYHMKRSEKEFKKYFDNVQPLPAYYLYSATRENVLVRYLPRTAGLHVTSIALQEIVGSLWYQIRGE